MRPPALLVVLLVATPVLAGCTEPPPPPPPPAPVLPALHEYADCPWTLPDGSPASCEGPGALVPGPSVPTGWICLAENPPEGWSFHWNPVTGERGIWYDVTGVRRDNESTDVDGVLYVRTGGAVTLFNWSAAPFQGFLVAPVSWGDNVTFRFLTYNYTYNWFSGGSRSAAVDELWSLHEDQFWVVHRVEDGNGTYTFQNMSTVESERRGGDGSVTPVSYHSPRSYLVEGRDFNFAAFYTTIFFGRSLVSIDTIGLERDCTL